MRAFVGFFTTKLIHEHVNRLQEETKGFIRGKWVEPQNLHITFQFLGNITNEQAISVIQNLQKIAEKFRPFSVQYKALGVFPDKKRPRILWMGVGKGDSALKKLALEVSNLNKKVGIKPDSKPFYPHVTICRLKEVDKKKLNILLNKYKNFFFGEETVDRIALISSTLTSVGPIYTVVEEFYFRG